MTTAELLTQEAILPVQFAKPHDKGATPERALALAVLHDAIRSFSKFRHGDSAKARREFDLARAWIESSDRRWPMVERPRVG